MLKKSKFKKIISTSIMALMVAGTIDSGILGIRQMYVHAATIEATQTYQNLKMPVSTSVIDETIKRTCNAVLNTHFSMDWTAIGLDKAGHREMIDGNYLAKVTKYLEDNNHKVLSPTEYERSALGILAAGGDPTKVGKGQINIIEKIYNADLDKQGINALVFGLIALDAKDYKIPDTATWNREKIIDKILKKQLTDGGWAFYGSSSDPDMTGMAMTALSPYYKGKKSTAAKVINGVDQTKISTSINNAVNCLSKLQLKEGEGAGGFESWKTINSESCAQVIMGLCTNGVDPAKDARFVKDGRSVVDALLSFEVNSTGAFAHKKDANVAKSANGMATEQALYALDQYKLFTSNPGATIYYWGK